MTTLLSKTALVLTLILSATSLVPEAEAEQKATAAQPADTITINFEEVELPVFVKFISRVTQRNFVFTEKVAGVVTVVSPTPVSVAEAYQVFESVLAVRGLTTVDDGVITRIVPVREARGAATVITGPAQGEAFVTRLIPLRFVDVGALSESLNPLVSKEGSLVAYRPSNTLIVTDTASNTTRIADVIRALDVEGRDDTVEVIPLQHADAATVADHIKEILARETRGRAAAKGAPAAPGEGGIKVVADERTNSLVVSAGVLTLRKIRALVIDLDTPLMADEGRLTVYYAKHADAEALVEVVSGMISAGRRRGGKGGDGPTAASGSLGLAEDVSLSADPATNAILIDASTQNQKVLIGLLESLDIQRPQVFVEAIIVEVSLDRAKELGFEFQAGGDIGDGVGLASTNLANLGDITSGAANPFSLSGLVLAAASDKTVEINGVEIPANIALFRALQADSNVEVLSAPTLLTLDNQQAEIVVGQNVPFVTSRGADSTNLGNVFTEIERRDVGITLRVTPQVSEGDVVVLTVEEEVSQILPNPQLDATEVGPTITRRAASTTVSINDGRTAAIGGLISDQLTDVRSQVPILGDIPIVGELFKSSRKETEKVNLIAFLTPHVIRDAEDLRRVTQHRKEEHERSLEDPDYDPAHAFGDPDPEADDDWVPDTETTESQGSESAVPAQ